MKEITEVFKALSDETRLRILNVLMTKECCVCEVMQALDISQSKASRHLSALHDAGFLKLRKDGLLSLYSLQTQENAGYMVLLLDAVRKAMGDRDVVNEDKERLKSAERIGIARVCRMKQKTDQDKL
jgi:ArsR family transcriptional regulator, arsenate/arsenite/antimonite-responsive transcriptional repressor